MGRVTRYGRVGGRNGVIAAVTCTLLYLARRRAGLSYDECIDYLDRQHTPLVRELPGLTQFTTSRPLAPETEGVEVPVGEEDYDVLGRLQFESVDALAEEFESESGARVRRDMEQFLDVEALVTFVVTDETMRFRSVPPVL